MRLRVIIAVGVMLAVAMLLMRDVAQEPAPASRPRRPRPSRPALANRTDAPASTRNVFEFAPRMAAEPVSRPTAPALVEAPTAPSPVAEPPVRFVGLVRRGGTLKAAVRIHGEPAVVGMGETAGGYTVVGIDEDGVRLRAADGSTLTLDAGGS
jgi:hypothetical protein